LFAAAVTVKLPLPVPEVGLLVNQGGPDTAQLTAGDAALIETVPTVPDVPVTLEKEVGLTLYGFWTLMDKVAVAVCCVGLWSVTVTVNDGSPVADGEPDSSPFEAKTKPWGSEPDVTAHV
jgi:hypothetical protein